MAAGCALAAVVYLQFKDWFCNPLNGLVEAGEDAGSSNTQAGERLVERLHGVLRPFLLRRMKMDVEKQLPRKYDHVLYCKLSKRQRTLYEEYMASGQTRDTLAGGSFIGMMNVLMQLRKVTPPPPPPFHEGYPCVSDCMILSLSTCSEPPACVHMPVVRMCLVFAEVSWQCHNPVLVSQ